MTNIFEFALLSFTSLITMMNPLSIIPLYESMTHPFDEQLAKRVAIKATFTAFLTLIIFALTGKIIFSIFSISLDSLRVVGGVIFFIMGYDMLQAKMSRTKAPYEDIEEFSDDIAITPLAIPMICGPGSITVTILLMQDATSFSKKIVLFSIIAIVSFIVFITLLGARKILNFIGPNGTRVMMRIMGLILMVIAVEFFISGLKPIIKNIME